MRIPPYNPVPFTRPQGDAYVPAGIAMTNAPALWARGITGAGKVAAIIDTGVDRTHPDLAGRIMDYIDLTGEGEQDDIGHGTHVAGIICANGSIRGVAPDAKLLVVKVIGRTRSCADSLVGIAVRRAVDWRGPKGERVSAINISLGGDVDVDSVHEAIQHAVTNNTEPVCSAGNDGDGNAQTPEYGWPGAYQESVQVSAVTAGGLLAVFSNTNGDMDFTAVGDRVDSLWPMALGGPRACLSGTSMAAPHITGLLLLEEQMFETINGRPFCDEAERWAFATANVRQLPALPREAQGLGLGYAHDGMLPNPKPPEEGTKVEIVQNIIPPGRRNRPAVAIAAKFITIHDTGNAKAGAGAVSHGKYLLGETAANLPVSWHYTVDDKCIVQHLPVDEMGYHAGITSGNSTSIGIEICENADGNRVAAEARAAELAASLLMQLGLPITAVVQHNHWSNKDCPHILRGRAGGWQGFLAAVQSHLAPPPAAEVVQLRARIAELEGEAAAREVIIAEQLATIRSIQALVAKYKAG